MEILLNFKFDNKEDFIIFFYICIYFSLFKVQDLYVKCVFAPKIKTTKSPQITTYVPVYTNKLLSTNSPIRNMENNESESEPLNVKQTISDMSEFIETITITPTEVENVNCELTPSQEETPLLANLIAYKEKQKEINENIDVNKKVNEIEIKIDEGNEKVTETENEDENQDEDEDEDTACEEYTDDDLDEALADEADTEEDTKENSQIYVNENVQNKEVLSQDESHYLPMTPKRIDIGQSGNLTLMNFHDVQHEEENPYVEMSKFLLEEEAKTNYEVMCIASTQTKSLPKPKQEPVYMELPSTAVKKKTNEDTEESTNTLTGRSILKKCKKVKKTSERAQSKRKDLPDILKPPQSIMKMNSDSSDADDESSKHIDAKKMRSRTRFSLSDTFRPASYYLGTSTPLNNCAESSDSEIVSPPAIPISPPPIEELKTEEIFSAENYDTVKRRDSNTGSKLNISFEKLPKMHASNISLNLPKTEATLKSSRLSLPDQFNKIRKTPVTPVTLSDSNYSFQTDNSSNTSSDFDLYHKLQQNSPSYVVTPLRYQSNSSLPQKYISHNTAGLTGDSSEAESVEFRQRQNSDSELERQRSRRPLSEESINEIELLQEKFEERINTHDLDSYLSNLQTSELYLYHNSNYETSNLLSETNLIKPPETFRNKDDEPFYGNIHFVSSTDSLQKLDAPTRDLNLTPISTDQEQSKFFTPLHSRNNSNISEQSAPYYYSELSSSREMLTTPTTLNNQRDIHALSSHITHIHNPIERNKLNVDKYQLLDNKNLYQTKTNVEKLNYSSCKNLKTTTDTTNNSSTTHAFHTTLNEGNGGLEKITNVQVASKVCSFLGASGELLWEEDALWRESLRRVSQRHAKSLDDLDRIVTTAITAPKSKITRDVTYVNEQVSQKIRANYSKAANDIENLNEEHDVYVRLMDNSKSDIYETLREETSSNISHKSGEIDRETIRQWDAMSSGITTKTFPTHNNTEALALDTNADLNANNVGAVQAIVEQLNARCLDDNGNAKVNLQKQ